MTIEQYAEAVLAAFDVGNNEKKLQEGREQIAKHMDDVIRPCFEQGKTPKECGAALFMAMFGAALKKK